MRLRGRGMTHRFGRFRHRSLLGPGFGMDFMTMMIPREAGDTVLWTAHGCMFNIYCGRACGQSAGPCFAWMRQLPAMREAVVAVFGATPRRRAGEVFAAAKSPSSFSLSDRLTQFRPCNAGSTSVHSVASGVAAASTLPTFLASSIMSSPPTPRRSHQRRFPP